MQREGIRGARLQAPAAGYPSSEDPGPPRPRLLRWDRSSSRSSLSWSSRSSESSSTEWSLGGGTAAGGLAGGPAGGAAGGGGGAVGAVGAEGGGAGVAAGAGAAGAEGFGTVGLGFARAGVTGLRGGCCRDGRDLRCGGAARIAPIARIRLGAREVLVVNGAARRRRIAARVVVRTGLGGPSIGSVRVVRSSRLTSSRSVARPASALGVFVFFCDVTVAEIARAVRSTSTSGATIAALTPRRSRRLTMPAFASPSVCDPPNPNAPTCFSFQRATRKP